MRLWGEIVCCEDHFFVIIIKHAKQGFGEIVCSEDILILSSLSYMQPNVFWGEIVCCEANFRGEKFSDFSVSLIISNNVSGTLRSKVKSTCLFFSIRTKKKLN